MSPKKKTPTEKKARRTRSPRDRLVMRIERLASESGKFLVPKYATVDYDEQFVTCMRNVQEFLMSALGIVQGLPADWKPSGSKAGRPGLVVGDYVAPKQGELDGAGIGPWRVLDLAGRSAWLDLGESGRALVAKSKIVKVKRDE